MEGWEAKCKLLHKENRQRRLSETALNNSGWGCAFLAGLLKIYCMLKGTKIRRLFPCTFLFTRVSCPPAIKPRRDFRRPQRSTAFVLAIPCQTCLLRHLSMCHFPSTFPLMRLLKKKNNCQTLLVTKRDKEAEKREPEMFFDEAEIPAFPFSRLCL